MKNYLLNRFSKLNSQSPEYRDARRYHCRRYAWAIPNEEAIKTIIKYSPLIEIGAGNGYWARLIADAGGEIIAYDNDLTRLNSHMAIPEEINGTRYWHILHEKYMHPRKYFYPVHKGDFSELASSVSKTLFLCWPPYDDPMSFECLKAFKGKHLIFVGEKKGGCTGTDEFFNPLYKDWTLKETVIIPRWNHVYDKLTVWKRRMVHSTNS